MPVKSISSQSRRGRVVLPVEVEIDRLCGVLQAAGLLSNNDDDKGAIDRRRANAATMAPLSSSLLLSRPAACRRRTVDRSPPRPGAPPCRGATGLIFCTGIAPKCGLIWLAISWR